jgi:DNA-binding response OmpR family regulator
MQRLSYDTAEVLVYDPVAANRNATRATLYMLGFRHIETVATLEAFAEYIFKTPPDLALCEAQGAGAQLCDLIQNLRQGAGENPFLVVIVTAWDNSNALVSAVLNSGADDLLLRPFSVAQLGQRVRAHIERRKGFVITTDYVGPDRRKDANRASNAELFEPPNSLKMKAKDKMSGEAIARKLDIELKSAREKLTTEKLRRDSFQVCILWRLMQEQPIVAGQVSPDLARLQALTKSIELRCRDGEFEAALEWCASVLAAAEGLSLDVDRNASMHLLGHGALSLHQVFHPEKSAAEQLSEIDATVAVIRARNQTEALAS